LSRPDSPPDLAAALASARAVLASARVALDQRAAVLAVVEEIDRAAQTLRRLPDGAAPVVPTALEREREGRVAAEASERRTEFVQQATSTLFSSPLDQVVRLKTLTALLVPDLGDWCICDLLLEGGVVDRLSVRSWNPDREELARSLEGKHTLSSPAMTATQRVASSGKPEVGYDRSGDAATAADGLFAKLAAKSYLVVPLTASGHVIGAITVLFAESNRRYTALDLRLLEDVAGRAALAVENARLVTKLERAVRSRDDLIAIVSHDLRNPLSSIQMSAALLQQTLGDVELAKRSKTSMILRAVDRMESLIRDLLDIASIEGGGVIVSLGDLPVGVLLGDAAELIQTITADKGIVLEVVPPTGDLHVNADSARLLQVFSNLLGNAVKFTPKGGKITIRATREGSTCRFTVADSGSGIPADQLPHVFDRFWRGRQQASTAGAGLGLAIAKGIVEAHAGTLSVTSEAGRGTAFTFAIPLSQR
jgi:signal transduction histidine kinase